MSWKMGIIKRITENEDMGQFPIVIGIGIALGIFAKPGWGYQAIFFAFIWALINVVLRGEHFRTYIKEGMKRDVPQNIKASLWYLLLSTISTSIVFFILIFAVLLIKAFLGKEYV